MPTSPPAKYSIYLSITVLYCHVDVVDVNNILDVVDVVNLVHVVVLVAVFALKPGCLH